MGQEPAARQGDKRQGQRRQPHLQIKLVNQPVPGKYRVEFARIGPDPACQERLERAVVGAAELLAGDTPLLPAIIVHYKQQTESGHSRQADQPGHQYLLPELRPIRPTLAEEPGSPQQHKDKGWPQEKGLRMKHDRDCQGRGGPGNIYLAAHRQDTQPGVNQRDQRHQGVALDITEKDQQGRRA